MRPRSVYEHTNDVDRYDVFSRVMVGQVLGVDPESGLLNVQMLDIPTAVKAQMPVVYSANGISSSWSRYMPEAFTYVRVAFDPNNRPMILGYTIPGASNESLRDGGYALKQQAALEGQVRSFRQLQLGEHDLRSSGGAGYYFTRNGQAIIEAHNLSVTLDVQDQSTELAGGDVVRVFTTGSAVILGKSSALPNPGSMISPERVVIRVGAQLPSGAALDAYRLEAGDLRNALDVPTLGPGAGFTRIAESAYDAGGVEVFSRRVDTTGAYEQTALLSQALSAPRIRLNAGGPADDVAVRGRALSRWLTTQLSVATAFGPSGPAILPLVEGVELSLTLEVR